MKFGGSEQLDFSTGNNQILRVISSVCISQKIEIGEMQSKSW